MNDIKWTQGGLKGEGLQPQITYYLTHALHSTTDQDSRS